MSYMRVGVLHLKATVAVMSREMLSELAEEDTDKKTELSAKSV